jgi:hypothetical protein
MFWLIALCCWQLFWMEWKRERIRGKLPVAQWPRRLYL